MLNFDEKLRKYKKIYIYPRNNHFKSIGKISRFNITKTSKTKSRLNQLLLDNNINQKNKTFMNYLNSKTSSNYYLKTKNKISLDYNLGTFHRNKSFKNNYILYNKNKNNNIINKYDEILEELRNMKQSGKSININININNDYQIKNNRKSRTLNKSSHKSLYEEINSKRNIINNNPEKNEQKENNNNINDDTKNTNIKINNNIKEKSIDFIKNIKVNEREKFNKEKDTKNSSQKIELIKSKINEINNIFKERSRSTPSNNVLTTYESNNTNYNTNNNSNIKYMSSTEEKNLNNYYKNIKEDILKNNKINFNTFNNEYSVNYLKTNNKTFKKQSDDLTIKEKYLYKNNKTYNNKNINLNISLFNEETDNQIQNWINKEKKNKELKKNLDINKKIVYFDVDGGNRGFQNYQISNKYFHNNEIFLKGSNKPIKSINLGDYFDLELSKFNNKLNNFNYIKHKNQNRNQNIINSGHIFKPIY